MISFRSFYTEVFKLPDNRPSNINIFTTNNKDLDPVILSSKEVIRGYNKSGSAFIGTGDYPVTPPNSKYKVYAALTIRGVDSDTKTDIFHYGRYRNITSHDSFARGFYAEIVSQTSNILRQLKPKHIITVSSKCNFNYQVIEQYKGDSNVHDINVADISEIKKITLGEYANLITTAAGSTSTNDIYDTLIKKQFIKPPTLTPSDRSRLADIATIYAVIIADILDGNIDSSVSVSAEALAGLVRDYKWVLDEKKREHINNISVSKQFIDVSRFFKGIDLNSIESVVVLDDNINTNATLNAVTDTIRKTNPNIDIKWVVGIYNGSLLPSAATGSYTGMR